MKRAQIDQLARRNAVSQARLAALSARLLAASTARRVPVATYLTHVEQLQNIRRHAPEGYGALVDGLIAARTVAEVIVATRAVFYKINMDGDSDTIWCERLDEIAREMHEGATK